MHRVAEAVFSKLGTVPKGCREGCYTGVENAKIDLYDSLGTEGFIFF
jgi:hypothetical protein